MLMADFPDPEIETSNDPCEVFMIRALLEVYSDDLIISSSQTTATGLSKVLENCFSFPATGSFSLMKSRRSLRNDGKLKNFINPLTQMLLSQNHRQER
jgi:hypothetical protein